MSSLLLGDQSVCHYVVRSASVQLIYSKQCGDKLVWKSRLKCGKQVDDKAFCSVLISEN